MYERIIYIPPTDRLNCNLIDCKAESCNFCGACKHERHDEECKQEWRNLILSYSNGRN